GLPFAPGSGVVGGLQTQWTLLGAFTDPLASPAAAGVFTFNASQSDAAGILSKPAIGSTSTPNAAWDKALLNTPNPAPGAGPGASTFLGSTDPGSFTTTFGLGGFLNGAWPQGGMQGSLGDVLNMIQGQARSGATLNVISDAGRAVLSASGTLDVC